MKKTVQLFIPPGCLRGCCPSGILVAALRKRGKQQEMRMERMKKRNIICLLLAVLMLLACTACGGKTSTGDTAGTRTITDSKNRTVTIPDKVERVVCVGVGALR